MSIKPRDLRLAAERQAAQAITEVDRRSVISRAYYAAYHRCRRWERQLPYPSPVATGGGTHASLIARLQAPDARCGDEVRAKAQALSALLRGARTRRVLADYQLREEVDAQAVLDQLDATRQVFEQSASSV